MDWFLGEVEIKVMSLLNTVRSIRPPMLSSIYGQEISQTKAGLLSQILHQRVLQGLRRQSQREHCFQACYYGKNKDRVLLVCKTCKTEFKMLMEKSGIRGTARALGVDKGTGLRWLDHAGRHCEELRNYFLHDLGFTQVQVDLNPPRSHDETACLL